MESKVIKGQAWIQGDSLVQEQILIIPGQVSATNVVALINNIWDDLVLDLKNGEYKSNGKGYFYWEVEMTSIEDDNINTIIYFECPKPKEDLFIDDPKNPTYDPSKYPSGSYGNYWVTKLKTATENYEKSAAIQRKEIKFPGTKYISQTGAEIELSEVVIKNNDLADIENLLNLL